MRLEGSGTSTATMSRIALLGCVRIVEPISNSSPFWPLDHRAMNFMTSRRETRMEEMNMGNEGSSLAQALSTAHVASFTSNDYRCATFSTVSERLR